jgi:hypothetical protein
VRFEDKIPPPINCNSAADCPESESFCHPWGHVCLKVCNSRTDCPSYLDQCAELQNPGVTTPKVCTCSDQVICSNFALGYACNVTDGLCERQCRGPEECSGFQPARYCERGLNLCLAKTQTCYLASDCTSDGRPRCDPVSHVCIGCGSNDDCMGRPNGRTRCSSDGACVPP